MYYLKAICCICLSNKGELKQMVGSESKQDYLTKLTSCIPEMHFKEINKKLLCKKCCDTVDTMYNYREKCLRNNRILNSYISQLSTFDNLNWELSIHLTDIARVKQEKCSETNYENEIKKENTDVYIPLPEARQMIIEYENDYQCDSNLSCIIKNEDVDLHSTDSELGFINYSNEIYSQSLLADEGVTAKETKFEIESDASEETSWKGNEYERKIYNEKSDLGDHQYRQSLEIYEYNKKFTTDVLTHNEDKVGDHIGINPHEYNLCGKQVIEKQHPSYHMMSHTARNLHECNLCSAQFTHMSQFNRHMMTHTREKPHECNLCHKKFTRKAHISRHMMTHTGERPHECNLCDKRFTAKQSLSRHIMTHTGDKPHECNLCGKKFVGNSDLTTHMYTHTGERPHECNICGKKFLKKQSLTRHMVNHPGEKTHEYNL